MHKPILIHKKGWISCVYLDDFLLYGKNYETCSNNVMETISLLENLGFIINRRKSNLIPNMRCQFLGFIIDSEKLQMEPTEDKKRDLIKSVRRFKTKSTCSIREFAKLIGSLVAVCPGIEYGPVHLKRLECAKNGALIINNNDFEKRMTLDRALREDFEWWETRLPDANKKIRQSVFEIEIFSDASLTG